MRPLVSICCATYNHDKYISQALDGFLSQKGDFDIEILIHDDASTDQTASIIAEYVKQYPDIIFPIYQHENQYSKGVRTSLFNYERCRGDFIAICEGDDFWTDKNKLAIQVDALLLHSEYDLCLHSAILQHVFQDKPDEIICKYSYCPIISTQHNNSLGFDVDVRAIPTSDVIVRKEWMHPTASTVLTKRALSKYISFMRDRPWLPVGDLYLHILPSLQTGALYIDREMSVYRYMTDFSWTKRIMGGAIDKLIHHNNLVVDSYNELNELTNGVYEKYFAGAIRKRLSVIYAACYYNNIKWQQLADNFYQKAMRLLDSLPEDNYIVYGASDFFFKNHKKIPGAISFIVDRNHNLDGQVIDGFKVYTLDKLKICPRQKIIICVLGRAVDVRDILVNDYNVFERDIIDFDSCFEDECLR